MDASRVTGNVGHPAATGLQRPAFRRAMQLGGVAPRQFFLPASILTLKLLASGLAGAAITLMFSQDDRISAVPHSLDPDRSGMALAPLRQESTFYARAPEQLPAHAGETQVALEQAIPSNFSHRVETMKLTPPTYQSGFPPAASTLAGKPLRYLIGAKTPGPGRDGEVTEVPYGAEPVKLGISIAYCNLFDELNTGRYGPYLHTSDTAKQYHEGQIDPRGPGWERNLREQFERRRKQGFVYIELDNPDAYRLADVLRAIALAQTYGLKVVAKNPGAMNEDPTPYVAHPNIYGIIVEKDAGETREGDATPAEMDALRKNAGKPELPVWFVSFGKGRAWASSVAAEIRSRGYHNMSVTYSSAGEYGNAIDVLPPSRTRVVGASPRTR